uniref:Uncharacterized protein n=1 Tax=Plectus sambesii TaxID=2011161 RepID=A0A914V7E7_9BILA
MFCLAFGLGRPAGRRCNSAAANSGRAGWPLRSLRVRSALASLSRTGRCRRCRRRRLDALWSPPSLPFVLTDLVEPRPTSSATVAASSVAVLLADDRPHPPKQQRPAMHDLLIRVLDGRQLSKAGQLFSISDYDVIADLHTALAKLKQIFNGDGYDQDTNSQSVVEICLARITSAIRLVITFD